jgi:hypothetical protein
MDSVMREQFRLDGREFIANEDKGEKRIDSDVHSVWFWCLIAACSGARLYQIASAKLAVST